MKSRCFAFTKFLETLADEDTFRGILERLSGVRYCIIGKEVAPTTGRKHYQGFIQFTHQRLLTQIQKILECHCEPMHKNSTPYKNYEYCMKDGDIWYEFGTKPVPAGEGEISAWTEAYAAAVTGDYEVIRPDIRVRYYNVLQRIHADSAPAPVPLDTTEPVGIWIYGPPGSGKTRYTFEHFPGHYKKGKTKWWCWYQHQPVVVIQDITPKFVRENYDMILEWADVWPFPAEFKGGNFPHGIRPQQIVFTSNWSLDEVCDCFEDHQRAALKRRFKCILIN